MDRELFDAFHTGDLLKLAEFDAAFGTPRIIFAYYQGGLEVGLAREDLRHSTRSSRR